jgi:putative addiction module component (TIGR02574 family)
MILETIPDVKSLSAAEKLLLVSELWDDLAAHPTEVPVSREQIAELDRRMEAYRRDPSQVTSWEAIQQRMDLRQDPESIRRRLRGRNA